MKQVKIQVEQLGCPSCVKKIEGAVKKQNGVESVDVLFNASKVQVTFNEDEITLEQIEDVIESVGYSVKK